MSWKRNLVVLLGAPFILIGIVCAFLCMSFQVGFEIGFDLVGRLLGVKKR